MPRESPAVRPLDDSALFELAIALDADEIERRRSARSHRLNTFDIPLLRVIGCTLLCLGVWLNNRYILHDSDAIEFLRALLFAEGYALGAWALLRTFHSRIASFDLGVLFLVLDIVVWTVLLYFSGGERSFLFFILIIRVADQTNTSFRRALLLGMISTASYLCMLGFIAATAPESMSWASGLSKAVFLAGGNLYISLTARTAEKRRASTALAIRTARELISQLRVKSGELELARLRAEEANSAKSDFLANMSHELRTPLNGIMGMVNLAMSSGVSREQRRYLEAVHSSATSLLGVVNQTLDLSKIEAGMMLIEPAPFSLRALVDEVMRSVAIRAEEKRLEFGCFIQGNVEDDLIADGMRIRQVLLNLLSNAIKFTGEGEVALEVRNLGVAADEAVLEFVVRDTGIGIPASKQFMIFEPFAQADGSTTRKYGGTGLGLSISGRIAQLMSGRISVESREAEGSTFRFEVPIRHGRSFGPTKRMFPRVQLSIAAPGLQGQMAAEIATALAMRAHLCSSEFELADSIEKEPVFQCVILDDRFAGDGLAVLQRLGGLAPLRRAFIALLPATASPALTGEWIRAGVSAVLYRPLSELAVSEAVAKSLHFEEKASARGREVAATSASNQSHRILLVEDNAVNQEIAAALLLRHGHRVEVAWDGEEAVEMFQTHRFDLILMDLQMPKLDGLAATRQIREIELQTGGRIPIIAMTAHALSGDRERCLEAGMDDYIAKPVTEAMLLAKVGDIQRQRTEMTENFVEPFWLSNLGGNLELASRALKAFTMQSPKLVEQLRVFLQNGDGVQAAAAAHKLKGSISNFTQAGASSTVVEIERAASAGDYDRGMPMVTLLEKQIAELVNEVEEALHAARRH